MGFIFGEDTREIIIVEFGGKWMEMQTKTTLGINQWTKLVCDFEFGTFNKWGSFTEKWKNTQLLVP